ncbi:ribosome-associated translation inhibitor RaiA [Patescibacteria group bacterium]|nr:ribosome-associated translation inhibitor RaiA [Patescibacteria group bacterium]
MQYILHTDHLSLSAADRDMLEKKLERLEKYLTIPFVTDVHFAQDQHHRTGQTITCTINIEMSKKVWHAERSGDTVQDALDSVIKALQNELRRARGKRQDSERGV